MQVWKQTLGENFEGLQECTTATQKWVEDFERSAAAAHRKIQLIQPEVTQQEKMASTITDMEQRLSDMQKKINKQADTINYQQDSRNCKLKLMEQKLQNMQNSINTLHNTKEDISDLTMQYTGTPNKTTSPTPKPNETFNLVSLHTNTKPPKQHQTGKDWIMEDRQNTNPTPAKHSRMGGTPQKEGGKRPANREAAKK